LVWFLFLYLIISYIFSIFKIEEKILINSVKKFLNRWDNSSIIWEHTINLKDDYLEVIEPWSTSKIYWNNVNKIVENEKYIFIYITSVSANIIPKFKLSNNEKEKVIEFIKSKKLSVKNQ